MHFGKTRPVWFQTHRGPRVSLALSMAAWGTLTLTMPESAAWAAITGQARVNFDKRQMMLPLRRVGLLPVVQNTVEARKTLSDQVALKGVLAQPLSADDFAFKFNAQVKAVADANGRFWALDALAEENASGRSPAAASELSSFRKSQLQKEYDLDGWVSVNVYFTADHTAVRVALLSAQNNSVIAREDVLLPFGSNWDALAQAYVQAFGRLSDTIGHDGRVVFENNELMGIDFGSERGISAGQRLKAGLVVQSAAHPQTGEVLRYQRTPLMEIEVVEVKQGAALCRKVATDPELLKQAEQAYGAGVDHKLPLLVWRNDATASVPAWQSPTSAGKADSVGEGFTSRPERPNAVGRLMPVEPDAKSNSSLRPEKPQDASASASQVAFYGAPASLAQPSVAQRDPFAPGAAMKVGVGVTEGTLQLSKGPVTSAVPDILFNQVWLRDGFRFNPEWDVHYGAEYVSFSGDTNGSRVTGRVGGMASAAILALPDLPLRWGAEGQLSSGTIKTKKSKKTLDALELYGIVATQRKLEGDWNLEGELKPSITGLLAGALAYEFSLDVHPGIAPKELGVQWKVWDDGDYWSEWSLGVTWKLGLVE
ncbi:MAG: hypothetical protein RIR26_2992 [Pseudomonadota bacterium]|jgi:hypothetical protein